MDVILQFPMADPDVEWIECLMFIVYRKIINGQKGPCLFRVRDHTLQLCGDYNEPL